MPLETIVVRAIIQVTLRLIKLRGPGLHRSRHIMQTLMIRSHYQAVSIVLRYLTVKSDDLHEAGALVDLTKLTLKLVEQASSVRKIVPIIYGHIVLGVSITVCFYLF